MIRVGICEDNQYDREKLRQYILEFMAERGSEITLDDYESGESFLEKWDGQHYHILFLDVYMHGMTGIELAKYIRTIDEKVMIIFTTSNASHALEGYKIHAYDYLIKPIQQMDFLYTLRDITNHLVVDDEPSFIFPTSCGNLKIHLKDIYYIESNIRKTNLYLEDEQYTCQYNINTLEEKLHFAGFIRTHRSFIVNMAKIKLIKATEVILDNGDSVFLSKYKQKEVKTRFMHYLGGNR
ncbi:MAG: LytTR family DNA-binding domain-containing protein [Niameybacter sp.]|uniref:LytR/AlgR family response regulator transcription factor n=1 Tax=Niameybacter sp. TaxID=2033640 RepID=UPI002FCA3AD0